MSTTIQTYPEVARPTPEGMHRNDMIPEHALYECFDLWASGAWPVENADANLDEVMEHIARLLKIPGQSVNSVQHV